MPCPGIARGVPGPRLRISQEAPRATRAPLARPRWPQALQSGAKGWGHPGRGTTPQTCDAMASSTRGPWKSPPLPRGPLS
eukprot:9469538-Pyramimonas_sp.AAC.1